MRTLIAFVGLLLPLWAGDWRLVWSDEFDKPGAPDPAKWTYEKGMVRNHEAQYYTPDRRQNARVEDGVLVIEARKEAFAGSSYTAASLTTESKASWAHARVEVRAKLPTGRGTWPAIWMLGNSHRTEGWPACGEIDIMENVGFDPDIIHANIHTRKYNHAINTGKGAKITVPQPHKDFHLYAVEWDTERMDFFVDGKKYFTYVNEKSGPAAWPYDSPHYLILNIAIGGDWGGQKGIDDAIFPQRMEVDYVRVYQK